MTVPSLSLLGSDALHEHILGSVSDGIHVIDLQGRVLIENAASARLLGWCGDCLVGKNGHAAIHHHHADGRLFPVEDCPIFSTLQDGQPREVLDDVFWRQDGSCFPVEYRTAPLRDGQGSIYGVTVVFRDITERKLAARMQAALHGLSTCAHDCDSCATLYPQIERLLGEVLPLRALQVALLDEGSAQLQMAYQGGAEPPAGARGLQPRALQRAWQVVQGVGPCQGSGSAEGAWLGAPLRLGGRIVGALVVEPLEDARPCTEAQVRLLQFAADQLANALERTWREQRLRFQAQYDALTELPNRHLFEDRLQVALGQAGRRREGLALVNIDLDKFKPINDTLGHAAGDALLRHVARRLKHALRQSDTVARVGGDEFVALLQPALRAEEVLAVAEKMRAALAQPFELEGQRVEISGSIGVALYPQHGQDAESLGRSADAAMYRAKRAGSSRVQLA
ncbi:diguanylate cyclase domain-containing protein [Inhella sp.]|uniref:diguanylate cyclase domain-containing protein n=1 Tax=Inhella sp. TaxID=1921806 RepID=UPI0035B0950A